ncbi:MAG: amidase [Pirellulaceae bacterium]|nr:amidase [Pirellulaceae bacterium]
MESLPTIVEASSLIRQGRLSPVDLVEHCLQQIDAHDGRLHAWVRIDAAGARREARRQHDLLRSGTDLGPLQGIPLGVKDIIDVAGWPTEAGSPLLAGRVAAEDAAVVGRLRNGGAVLLGKTVTTEFAFLDPASTRNPWNPEHTPGGSSSGSAAAVAAGMCLGALGSQTGGSIIRPASYCGVAGLKATRGRIEMRGVVPVSRSLDHVGPIARCVGDLRLLLGTIGGWSSGSEAAYCTPPKLMVIREYFLDRCDEAVREATLSALECLQQAGAELISSTLPESFRNVHSMHRCIMAVEAAEAHFDSFARQPDAYSQHIGALLEEGLTTFAVDYSLSLRHQQLFREQIGQMLGEDGVAVMPATMTPAPRGLESTGDPSFNSPWTYAGVPAVTIPCGMAPDGLPCGLQLIAPEGRDELLIEVARWCEEKLEFQDKPPLI